ncbi:MAG: transglycosylase domain-containing protein [Thermoanaerobaculia bacterium]
MSEQRAPRSWVAFEAFPEYTWRAVLAIEDARFFDHGGVDPRSVARAVLKNAKAGRVKQGGSTITQQLVKIRDLTPRRTLGRKVSEAVRAVALEAEYSKEAILEAYLNSVYMGHLDGSSLYGFRAATRAYFNKRVEDLTVGESALLAAVIQGPNRLHPRRHAERALGRQRAVLDRLEELEWVSPQRIRRAWEAGLPSIRRGRLGASVLPSTLAWIREDLQAVAPRRARSDRGLIVETTLDPQLRRGRESRSSTD